MIITGFAAEYNPFHNGHLYHLEKSREITGADYVVAVMSGNFVQRGDAAIIDKFARTKMALENGADMVIELPVYFSAASAQYFAQAAVSLLAACGADHICFGAETGQIDNLSKTADFLIKESLQYKAFLKEEMNSGSSYPKARCAAINKCGGDGSILTTPNNILAVEYLQALKKLSSSIKPHAVPRKAVSHNEKELTGEISSATAIREKIHAGDYSALDIAVPKNTLPIWQSCLKSRLAPMALDRLSVTWHYILRTADPGHLKNILDVNEGLENKFIAASGRNFSISSIIKEVKSKRHTQTKLQRAAVHILLDITAADFQDFLSRGGPQYVRVLGFRRQSSRLLSIIQKNSNLPVVTNLKYARSQLNERAFKMLNKEITATDVILLTAGIHPKKWEYKVPIVII